GVNRTRIVSRSRNAASNPAWWSSSTSRGSAVVRGGWSGLAPPEGTRVVWQPGEREEWLTHGHQDNPQQWEQYAADYHAGTLHPYYEPAFFTNAPDDLPRELVTSWRPRILDTPERWLPRFVARYERDALPVLMLIASKQPLVALPFL